MLAGFQIQIHANLVRAGIQSVGITDDICYGLQTSKQNLRDSFPNDGVGHDGLHLEQASLLLLIDVVIVSDSSGDHVL